ncbi:MAG: MoxR family ATPase [Planctomycetes bacterium]|nr:MoxR family ATPase [Planctomycetota bacterium]
MTDVAMLEQETQRFRDDLARVRAEVGKTIVGQPRVVEGVLTALLCGGHVLLEGVPGLGKTELVKALSRTLDLQFRRIQFTPDLMPADIIGTAMMNPTGPSGAYQFDFKKGPIFTQLLLADEINRATPKTQSALLETMQEGSVTTAGTTYRLDQPFVVLATQNPLEQEGTYPLPEAQLDRFLFKFEVPFPTRAELNEVVSRTILKQAVEPQKVMDAARILSLRQVLEKVVVADAIREYAVALVLATHPESEFAPERVKRFVRWGASPRAAQALVLGGKIQALVRGQSFVSVEEIRAVALPALRHRLLLNFEGEANEISTDTIVQELLTGVAP